MNDNLPDPMDAYRDIDNLPDPMEAYGGGLPDPMEAYQTIDDNKAAANKALKDVTGRDELEMEEDDDFGQDLSDSIKKGVITGGNYILTGLDYLGNVSRTAMNAKATGKDWWEQSKEAFEGRRHTSSSELRESMDKISSLPVFNKFGVDNDGETQWGDVGDVVTDMAVDVVTDPLTWLSLGISGVVKSAAKKAVSLAAKKTGKEYIESVAKKSGKALANVGEASVVDDAMNVMAKVDRQKMADSILLKGTLAGQGVKNVGQPIIGGILGANMGVDDDTDIGDRATKFLMGAGATVVGKQFYNRVLKSQAAKIGEKMNRFVGTTEVVNAQGLNHEGKLINIPTNIPMSTAGEITTEAGQKAITANALIHHPLQTAINRMKAADPIGAGVSLEAISDLRNQLVSNRNEIWKEELGKLNVNQLGKQRLTKDMSFEKAPEDARGLINHVVNKANASMLKADGNVRDDVLATWATKRGLESTDRIQENLLEWNKATKESFEVEKKFIYENYTDEKFLEELLPARAAAVKGKKGVFLKGEKDLQDVKGMLDLKMNNPGLSIWSPRKMDKGMATTKLASDEAKKIRVKNNKRAKSTAETTKRDYIGKAEGDIDLATITPEQNEALIKAFEDSVSIKAKEKAKGTLNISQKELSQNFGDFISNKSTMEQTLRKLNGVLKQGMLLGKYTWLTNNYWSNMRQAYVKGGLMEALDTSVLVAANNKTKQDIQKLFLHKRKEAPVFDFADDEMKDMIRLGVVDAPVFNDARRLEEDYAKFLYSEETVAKMKDQSGGVLDTVRDKFDAYSKLIGTRQLGTFTEAYARGVTYKNTVKVLRDRFSDDLTEAFGREAAEESLKKEATRITNETFFDYGKLRYWERSVARELIPFYSFYKQNLFYQAKSLMDPTRTNRIAQLARMGDGRYMGAKPLTDEQKHAMPEYVRSNNAGIYTDAKGEQKIFYSTSDPALQAFQMLNAEYWFKGDFAGQINPLITTILGQVLSYDTFRRNSMSPEDISNDPKRKVKHLFSRGYLPAAFSELVTGDKSGPVWVDQNGNPVTDSEAVVRIDNLASLFGAMFDLPIQVAGQIGKVMHGKQSYGEMVNNLYGPVKTTTIKSEQFSQRIKEYWELEREKADPEYYNKLRRSNQYQQRVPVQ